MNFFEEQKRKKDLTIENLEQISKSIEELKTLETELQEVQAKIKNTQDLLSRTLLKVDITKVNEKIQNSIFKIDTDTKGISNILKQVKKDIEIEHRKALDFYLTSWKIWALWTPLVISIFFFTALSWSYIANIRYIKTESEELVKENRILKNKLETMYGTLVLDKKFWYDSKNQNLYLDDNSGIKEFIKKQQKENKTKK